METAFYDGCSESGMSVFLVSAFALVALRGDSLVDFGYYGKVPIPLDLD